jgi:hypothetical protein
VAAVLRAAGSDFDVDAFLAGCTLPVLQEYRRGEPLDPAHPSGRLNRLSGVSVEVSEAGFDQFAEQVAEAVAFLGAEGEQVRRLVGWPGVEGVTLDFGLAWRDVVAQTYHFPADLVRLAGALGLALELSHYPVSGDSKDAEP